MSGCAKNILICQVAFFKEVLDGAFEHHMFMSFFPFTKKVSY